MPKLRGMRARRKRLSFPKNRKHKQSVQTLCEDVGGRGTFQADAASHDTELQTEEIMLTRSCDDASVADYSKRAKTDELHLDSRSDPQCTESSSPDRVVERLKKHIAQGKTWYRKVLKKTELVSQVEPDDSDKAYVLRL